MAFDWTQFRDGDRVRVTFEGTWWAPDQSREDRPCFGHLAITGESPGVMSTHGTLSRATSAELIERPFVAPRAGKLFRSRLGGEEFIYMSHGDDGYRELRINGVPAEYYAILKWRYATTEMRDSIEVLPL